MEVNALSMKNIVSQIISTVNDSNILIWNFYAIYVINYLLLWSNALQNAKTKPPYFVYWFK